MMPSSQTKGTLTQLTLDAAIGEAVAECPIGRRTMPWGATCGVALDLDVFNFHQADVSNARPTTSIQLPGLRSHSRLHWVWAWIGNPDAT